MTELYNDFEQIWRLCKILRGIDVPYWLKGKNGERVLFQYHKGYREFLQKDIEERIRKYNETHHVFLLNGERK